MEPSSDIERLIEIMAVLRDPDGGCPWDLEQSFETIAPYTIEEAYEVADAIERRDAEDLREELGDLLLQSVYHSQLASEAGLFVFGDVVEGITAKMIRRHPHVFGDTVAHGAKSAKGEWERIKAQERSEKAARRLARAAALGPAHPWSSAAQEHPVPLLLDSVQASFPALTLAVKLQEKAAKVGFDWDSAAPIVAKIAEETAEFDEALALGDRDAMEDELGDLLFSLVNLARFHAVDPEKALRRSAAKFRTRFDHIERSLLVEGRSLASASLEEMETLWTEAKTAASPKV